MDSLVTPEQFAAAMGALGVGDGSRVVLYSANNPDWAARVWWMLRWAGFDQVALLDGGLQAWIADGQPLSTEPATRPAKQFTATARPGHILGATNMPSSDLLDAAGHYRPYDELEMVYDGDDRNSRVITYCGGGVAASSVAFTMHRLGFTDVAVYMGSLQEWAADPANPMTLDTQ